MAAREPALLPENDMVAAAESRKQQVRNTWIAAFSNLSTAYNLVNINLAHVVLQNQYCGGDHCKAQVTTVGTACLVGAIVGQLTFGYVGDCIGRGRALQLTMILSILGALVSAFAVPITSDPKSIFIFISISRLFLGVGVGGVYPLAATIAAESSDNANRGRTVSLVFSMQGVGTVMVPLVGMLCLYTFGTFEHRDAHGLGMPGIAWRLILGVGALPGIILLPFKTKSTQEAQRANDTDRERVLFEYTYAQFEHQGLRQALEEARHALNLNEQAIVVRDRDGCEVDTRYAIAEEKFPVKALFKSGGGLSLWESLKMRENWKPLMGCAGGWFLFDITFYGNTLFAPTVLQSVFPHKGYTPTIGNDLEHNLCWQLLILAMIGLPGYYISVALMDTVGRKKIQIQGFCFMALLYATLALFLDQLKGSAVLLLIIYGLTYFFSNFGPNSTTFILPSESFEFHVRSSLNGFCAAMGKVGATVGSACFKPIVNAAGPETVFWLCTVCAGLGVLVSVACIDDRKGRGMRGTSFMNAIDPDSKPTVRC